MTAVVLWTLASFGAFALSAVLAVLVGGGIRLRDERG